MACCYALPVHVSLVNFCLGMKGDAAYSLNHFTFKAKKQNCLSLCATMLSTVCCNNATILILLPLCSIDQSLTQFLNSAQW